MKMVKLPVEVASLARNTRGHDLRSRPATQGKDFLSQGASLGTRR